MARLPRVVVVDVPHHVTQRGNARQVIFSTDADRVTYLDLLREYSQLYCLSLLGFCLMSNHVHLIAVPQTPMALAHSLKQAHGRYASYWNVRQRSTGHVWQGRFYSCPLDESHLWTALRYVELNPVRAGMVETAQQWRWSSAAAHCGLANPHATLEMKRWRQRWTAEEWREFLSRAESGGWPGLSELVFCFPFQNWGCPVLAIFARAGTMLSIPWDLPWGLAQVWILAGSIPTAVAPPFVVLERWAPRTSTPMFIHHRRKPRFHATPNPCPTGSIAITARDILTSLPPVVIGDYRC